MADVNTNPIKKKKKSDFWNQAEVKAKIQSNQKPPADVQTGAGDAFARAQAARENLRLGKDRFSPLSKDVAAGDERVSAIGKYAKKAARAIKKAATTVAIAGALHTASPSVAQSQTLPIEKNKIEKVIEPASVKIDRLAIKMGKGIKEQIDNSVPGLQSAKARLAKQANNLETTLNMSSISNLTDQRLMEVENSLKKDEPESAQQVADFKKDRNIYANQLLTLKGLNEAISTGTEKFNSGLDALQTAGVKEETLAKLSDRAKVFSYTLDKDSTKSRNFTFHLNPDAPTDSVYLYPANLGQATDRNINLKNDYRNFVGQALNFEPDKFLNQAIKPEYYNLISAQQKNIWHEALGHGLTTESYHKTLTNYGQKIRHNLTPFREYINEGAAETIALTAMRAQGKPEVVTALNQPYKAKYTPYFMMAARASTPDGSLPIDELMAIDENDEVPFLRDEILPRLIPALLKHQQELRQKNKIYDGLYNILLKQSQKNDFDNEKIALALQKYENGLSGSNGLWQKIAYELSPENGQKIYEAVLKDIGNVNLSPDQFSKNIKTAEPRPTESADNQQLTINNQPTETRQAEKQPVEEILEQKVMAPKMLSEEEIKNQLAGVLRADQFENEKEAGMHPPQIEKPLLESDKIVLPPSAGARPMLTVGQKETKQLTGQMSSNQLLTGRVDSLAGKFSSSRNLTGGLAQANQAEAKAQAQEQPDYGLGGRLMNRIQPGWQEKVGSQLSNATGGLVGSEDLEFAMDLAYDNLDRTLLGPLAVAGSTVTIIGPFLYLIFFLTCRLPHGFEFGLDKQKLKMTAKWATIIATSGAGAGAAAGAEAGGASAAMKGAQTAGTMAEKGGLSSVGTSRSFTQEITAGESQSTEQKIMDELKSRQQQAQNAPGLKEGGDSGLSGLVWGFFKRKYRWTVPEPIFGTIIAFGIVLFETWIIFSILYLLGVFGDIASSFSDGIFGIFKGIFATINYLTILGEPLIAILKEIVKGVIGL